MDCPERVCQVAPGNRRSCNFAVEQQRARTTFTMVYFTVIPGRDAVDPDTDNNRSGRARPARESPVIGYQ